MLTFLCEIELKFMKFQIKNDFIEATFDTLGAELISLKSNEREYIWEMNLEFWNRHSPIFISNNWFFKR